MTAKDIISVDENDRRIRTEYFDDGMRDRYNALRDTVVDHLDEVQVLLSDRLASVEYIISELRSSPGEGVRRMSVLLECLSSFTCHSIVGSSKTTNLWTQMVEEIERKLATNRTLSTVAERLIKTEWLDKTTDNE